MPKVNFCRHGDALFPADRIAEDALRAFTQRDEITLELKKHRNSKHHRLFFALLNEVVESGAWDGSTDTLLDACKFWNGYYTTMILDGQTLLRPKSISFESMGQAEFNRFYDGSVKHICEKLLNTDKWEAYRDTFLSQAEGMIH